MSVALLHVTSRNQVHRPSEVHRVRLRRGSPEMRPRELGTRLPQGATSAPVLTMDAEMTTEAIQADMAVWAAAILEPLGDDECIPGSDEDVAEAHRAVAEAQWARGQEAGAPLIHSYCHTAWLQRETRKHLQRALHLAAQGECPRHSVGVGAAPPRGRRWSKKK
jgi:hypothetical protein